MRPTTRCVGVLSLWVLAALLTAAACSADISPHMSYQGLLRDGAGAPVPDGDYAITFWIYDAETGGTALWNESQTITAEGGLVDVLLGTATPLNTLAFDVPYWLGISIEGEAELAPRMPFTSVPYAAHAGFADTVLEADDDWEITGGDIVHTGGDVTIEGELHVSGSGLEQGHFSTSNSQPTVQALSGVVSTGGTPSWGRGVYGENVSGDGFGYGGYFKGGGVGVTGQVLPTGSGELYRAVLANCNGGSGTNYGVWASAQGTGANYGIRAEATGGSTNWAGYFSGDVGVTATLTAGQKNFRIDHPLDPENMYLQHSCVESDEMMNVYNGNVTLDGAGESWVELPDWFEALNEDFRYQLTCIGGFAPVYVAEEVRGNRFLIAGGEPGMKVSWLVSGVRHDPLAVSRGLVVERRKEAGEAGKYLHPEAYGLTRTDGIDYVEDPETPAGS